MLNLDSLDTTAPAAQSVGEKTGAEPGGLPDSFMTELALRHLSRRGELRLAAMKQLLGVNGAVTDALLIKMRSLQLVEVPRRGSLDGDVSYALTDTGHRQARLAMEKCQYVGPAPVTLSEYVTEIHRQAREAAFVRVADLREALGDLVIDEALLPALGGSMNSGKAMYLYGESGSGKTYLAEHLVKTLHGTIRVPHALYVEGEVVQLYDPTVHRAVSEAANNGRSLALEGEADGRWVRVQRPVVVAGGELTLAMLDLQYDPHTRVHVAPPQMKANNGIFVIDDLGRQRVAPRELMNRWIVPLDRKVDYLGLHSGIKFELPFDVKVVFSSNLSPEQLVDPAFARRLGYKIHVPELSPEQYREVVTQACARAGVPPDAASIDHLVDGLHPRHGRSYFPCIPHDVIGKIADRACYLDEPPRMTPELIEWAWELYFGGGDDTASAEAVQSLN
ncbi:ATP-binding protein [Ramlibacter sp. 2FC]|uniref:ATP-binding protein n=1 Tax=Ramlibacter sp. 2FC TaxID=2502188 RepID=UPI0010F7E810|nr:ATP-binding protein [Ramlibacter sp. 2FC]